MRWAEVAPAHSPTRPPPPPPPHHLELFQAHHFLFVEPQRLHAQRSQLSALRQRKAVHLALVVRSAGSGRRHPCCSHGRVEAGDGRRACHYGGVHALDAVPALGAHTGVPSKPQGPGGRGGRKHFLSARETRPRWGVRGGRCAWWVGGGRGKARAHRAPRQGGRTCTLDGRLPSAMTL